MPFSFPVLCIPSAHICVFFHFAVSISNQDNVNLLLFNVCYDSVLFFAFLKILSIIRLNRSRLRLSPFHFKCVWFLSWHLYFICLAPLLLLDTSKYFFCLLSQRLSFPRIFLTMRICCLFTIACSSTSIPPIQFRSFPPVFLCRVWRQLKRGISLCSYCSC